MATAEPIDRGARVVIRDAHGRQHDRIALSPPRRGEDPGMVVWVCRIEEWEAARAAGREPDGVPWPAEDVTTPGGLTDG